MLYRMSSPFRLTRAIAAFYAALALAACVLALWVPKLSLILGVLGGLAVVAVWFKASMRTGKLAWWESGIASITREEVLMGLSGAVLYAAGFVALMAGRQHAL
jgi:hypothetical protein